MYVRRIGRHEGLKHFDAGERNGIEWSGQPPPASTLGEMLPLGG
jgi:hypothetical protein